MYLVLLKLLLSPGLRFHYLVNLFGTLYSVKMDDDRELRITSIIGVVMLLLAMMPKDIRRDFVSRLQE